MSTLTHTLVNGMCTTCGETEAYVNGERRETDTIMWAGERVERKLQAYQSREAATYRSRLAGAYSVDAEYAVKDQQGLILKRFATMEEARAYAGV